MSKLAFGAVIRCHRCKGAGITGRNRACLTCAGSGYMGLPAGDPEFAGDTYEAQRDKARLSAQLAAVLEVMRSRGWVTLPQLAAAAHCSTQSASARVRDLRKAAFGGHTIDRRYVRRGLFEYRLSR